MLLPLLHRSTVLVATGGAVSGLGVDLAARVVHGESERAALVSILTAVCIAVVDHFLRRSVRARRAQSRASRPRKPRAISARDQPNKSPDNGAS